MKAFHFLRPTFHPNSTPIPLTFHFFFRQELSTSHFIFSKMTNMVKKKTPYRYNSDDPMKRRELRYLSKKVFRENGDIKIFSFHDREAIKYFLIDSFLGLIFIMLFIPKK